MKEYPILFSGPMIRAILEGEKTQTRRILNPQPEYVWGWGVPNSDPEHFCAHVRYPGQYQPDPWVRCLYGAPPNRGKPGSRLWVRETWFRNAAGEILYRADYGPESYEGGAKGWRPSIHMPRTHSRLLLEVVGIRVERVREISEADARAEGVSPDGRAGADPHKYAFKRLWNEINGKRGYGWDVNPWVWAITFKRVV